MAGGKKMSERFSPLLNRYNGDPTLFGNHIRWAWNVVTHAFHPIGDVSRVANKERVNGPSAPR